jgi:uncharacterized membrane protein YbhN (UPF0104 family)
MNKANLGRSLFLLALAAFFGYRYSQTESVIYLALGIGGGAIGLLALLHRISTRWQNVTLNLGISLFFLDFVFAEIEWQLFARAMAEANYWWLIPSTICVMMHLFFRTLRWQWLLKPIGEVAFWPAFRALTIGITGNAVLPARAGEFIRAYVIGRSTGVSKTGAFATLVVERIFDGLTVLVLVGVIVLGVQIPIAAGRAGGGAVFCGPLVALVFFLPKHWADAWWLDFCAKSGWHGAGHSRWLHSGLMC